ncbi:MAG: dimethylsulfonioproprionate lyase family protein [Pseudomonadota bacterium]
MTTQGLFEDALAAVKAWHGALPAASAFCQWPDNLRYEPRSPHTLPATDLVKTAPGNTSPVSIHVVRAFQALALYLEWRLTYTADEVGQHFLDNFGWFELAGPTGHFITHQTRITVGYWGPGLDYPRHQHRAEELYTVLSGSGLFKADGVPDRILGPEDTCLHLSDQPHALITQDSPILTLVFWRGDGLGDAPALSPS